MQALLAVRLCIRRSSVQIALCPAVTADHGHGLCHPKTVVPRDEIPVAVATLDDAPGLRRFILTVRASVPLHDEALRVMKADRGMDTWLLSGIGAKHVPCDQVVAWFYTSKDGIGTTVSGLDPRHPVLRADVVADHVVVAVGVTQAANATGSVAAEDAVADDRVANPAADEQTVTAIIHAGILRPDAPPNTTAWMEAVTLAATDLVAQDLHIRSPLYADAVAGPAGDGDPNGLGMVTIDQVDGRIGEVAIGVIRPVRRSQG